MLPLEEALDDSWFAPHPFHRVAQFVSEMRNIEAAHITEFDPFELLPEALARIQFRRIRRQALQVKALRRATGQELLDDTTAVNGVYATFVRKLSVTYYTHNLGRINPPLFCV